VPPARVAAGYYEPPPRAIAGIVVARPRKREHAASRRGGTEPVACAFAEYRQGKLLGAIEEETVVKYMIAVGGVVLLAANPALAVGANCGDQLAQIKGQASSELLAQSEIAQKYQQAERLCSAGKDMEAQQLAGEIREQMAQKGSAGSSGAPTSAGGSVGGAAGQSK
jgi:hypothetical protein